MVDAETSVLDTSSRFLARAGYRVFRAASAKEALGIARSHLGRIDLLLTAVETPRGVVLAKEIRRIRHGVRVLFMSASAQPVIEAEALLGIEFSLIEKPLVEEALLRVVRSALDAKDQSAPTGN